MENFGMSEAERKATAAFAKRDKSDAVELLAGDGHTKCSKAALAAIADRHADTELSRRELERTREKRDIVRLIGSEFDIKPAPGQNILHKQELFAIAAEVGVFGDG